jgi:hypothetical protein
MVPPGGRPVSRQLFAHSGAVWSWPQLSEPPLHRIAKGVLTDADARAAVEAGADAVLVSNRGVRQFDGVSAASTNCSRSSRDELISVSRPANNNFQQSAAKILVYRCESS